MLKVFGIVPIDRKPEQDLLAGGNRFTAGPHKANQKKKAHQHAGVPFILRDSSAQPIDAVNVTSHDGKRNKMLFAYISFCAHRVLEQGLKNLQVAAYSCQHQWISNRISAIPLCPVMHQLERPCSVSYPDGAQQIVKAVFGNAMLVFKRVSFFKFNPFKVQVFF
jgi:hypothetical protein